MLAANSACAEGQAVSIPELDHVFLIMMENHAYGQIIGNRNAPFINGMARSANLAANYFAVGHPSLTNYLEIVGGSNFGIINDHAPAWHNTTCTPDLVSDSHAGTAVCPIAGSGMDAPTEAATIRNEGTPASPVNKNLLQPAPVIARTIADQLVAAGKRWKTYQENLPASGADNVNYADGTHTNLSPLDPASVQPLYAVKHNPFIYFAHIQENADPANGLGNMAGFTGSNGLYTDLRAGKIPHFSFIVPNQCHDMHGTGNGDAACHYEPNPLLVQAGDASVKTLVTAIKASRSWKKGRNAIVVMWDENDYSTAPNQVVMIVETNYGVHGIQSNEPYDHFSLLKTLEEGFGLPCLNHACDSTVKVMADLFRPAPK
ncbi:MAG: phosphoesterase [Sideroxydans sp.]|nr:phosphoesterase [Sideroxydans sp.]